MTVPPDMCISQQELNAMRDPLARMIWEKWIAEGKAKLEEPENG